MTAMTFTELQLSRENAIVWTANRMQYMTNADKLQVSSQMFDRAVFTLNNVLDIWNLPHVEGGDKRYIRKEYIEISQLDATNAVDYSPVQEKKPEQEEPINDTGTETQVQDPGSNP